MPRRNKIELQGLVDRIVDMFYKDKMTQQQIAELCGADESLQGSCTGSGSYC